MKKLLSLFLGNYQALSILLMVPLATASVQAQQQPFARWTSSELVLNNGVVERTIKLPALDGHFLTTAYKPVGGEFKYFQKSNPDFQFEINEAIYSGSGEWKLVKTEKITDAKQGDGAAVTLQSKDGKVELTVNFLLYPDLPVIRKSLTVKNLTNESVRLESVDVEKFVVTNYNATTFSWICHDYGRRRSIGPYDGNFQDALLTVHNSDWQQGIVIGNEAAGVVKHTSVFWDEPVILSGLTHKDARFPFRKYIAAGESFTTLRYLRWSTTTTKIRTKC
ncbi:hypothetical protein [Spirosoma telluris]|uniref:hypothetical protein n=1 Tax=Spirosoma telluris TaxID=2183553 RepID=UPI002FC3D024